MSAVSKTQSNSATFSPYSSIFYAWVLLAAKLHYMIDQVAWNESGTKVRCTNITNIYNES